MFFLLLADIMIALNIITIGRFASGSNPAILAMGQLFFTSLISLFCWLVESKINNTAIMLPREPMFWGSVIFISFFIRGLYTVVQIYAQRYVSPVNAALIFSSEIIMTLLLSGLVYRFIFEEPYYEEITLTKIIGVIFMLVGILMSEIDFTDSIFNKKRTKVIE
jgi:drug/metabolite transporter (DMT)-like permease